jgi:hypothetical protein
VSRRSGAKAQIHRVLAGAALAAVGLATLGAYAKPGSAQTQPLALSQVQSSPSVAPGQAFTVGVAVLWDGGESSRTIAVTTTLDAGLVVRNAPDGDCQVSEGTVRCVVTVSRKVPASLVFQLQARATAEAGIHQRITTQAQDQDDATIRASSATVIVIAGVAPTTIGATSTPTATSAPTAAPAAVESSATATITSPTSHPEATPAPPGYESDRCEPNDTLVQPCALPTEEETGDLTFVDDETDVFSLLLKGGRSYTIRATSADGIDPALTVYLAGATDRPIAQNDDVASGSHDAAVQLTTNADGWYLVRVDNKAPGDMRGRTCRLSARSNAPAADAPSATPQTGIAPLGDAYENNYSVETAARLAWGVPYDLSLICPEAGMCRDGDHDFFFVPVKAGVPLVAATYDLGPGADTTLTL